MKKTVAFLHTSGVLIPMFRSIAEKELEGTEQFHMVDESLIKNTIRAGELTRETTRRVIGMVGLAHEGGADAVLVTCSSIGGAATAAANLYDFPVVRVDDAMAEEAVKAGKRIGVAATLSTTLAPTVALLKSKAAEAGREIEIVESLCSKAFEAVLAGDGETHDRLLSAALISLMEDVDVVVLAQASMARVAALLPTSKVPVLSSPELAVKRVRSLMDR